MKMKGTAKWLVVAALISAVGYVGWGRQSPSLTKQEKQHVSDLTGNLKTHCVGRYLIDVPANALVSGDATVEKVRIEAKAMPRDAYLQAVKERQAELRGTASFDRYPFLYEDDEIDGPDAHYFISRGNPGYGSASRVLEAYKWDRGYRFELQIEGSDFLHPDQTTVPSIAQLPTKNDVPEKRRLVFDLVRRLQGRPEEEIPTEPGLCFMGGFLPGKAGDKEDAGAQFVLAGNRDVSIGFESDSGTRESNTLLQRGKDIKASLAAVRGGRTIRTGSVSLQGMAAEEWLATGETQQRVMGVTFTLEANSVTSSALAPLVTLDLWSGTTNAYMQGDIQAASLSESEAIALWDIVSRTLRPRPNGF